MPRGRRLSMYNGDNFPQHGQAEPMYISLSDESSGESSSEELPPAPGPSRRNVAPLPRRGPGRQPVAQRRPGQGADAADPILLSSDDEDDAVQAAPAGARRNRGRLPSPVRFRQDMDALDAAIGRARRFENRRREAARARNNDLGLAQPLDQRDRQIALDERAVRELVSPPPVAGPAQPARGGFGGAVLRRGGIQINYRPNQPAEARVRFDVDGDADEVDEEDVQPNADGRQWLDGVGLRHRGGGAEVDPNRPVFGAGGIFEPGFGQRMAANVANLDHALLNFMNAIGRAGGPAARGGDVKAILDRCKPEIPSVPTDGFTRTWEAEDLVKEVEENEKKGAVLELDDYGRVVPDKSKPRGQPYLACAACPEPLRVGSANRSEDDRVWALRCGHLLDERCFHRYAEPDPDVPILDDPEPSTKRRRSGRNKKASTRAAKKLHTWSCPVKGCGCEHVSILEEDKWVPKKDLGGIQVYV